MTKAKANQEISFTESHKHLPYIQQATGLLTCNSTYVNALTDILSLGVVEYTNILNFKYLFVILESEEQGLITITRSNSAINIF